MKLPVFLLASAITLSDGRKSTVASSSTIASTAAHVGPSVEAGELGHSKNLRNNLAVKLSATVAGYRPKDRGRQIAGSPKEDDRSRM